MEQKFAYKLESLQTGIISEIVKSTGCQLYLELGIESGNNIREVKKYCNNCIGVDIQDIREFKDFEFHKTTTDDFFTRFEGHPNIIFIDANHDIEQVKKDFINSLKCISEHGIIFLHDTDPHDEYLSNKLYCSDSYKIHEWLENTYSELNFIKYQ